MIILKTNLFVLLCSTLRFSGTATAGKAFLIFYDHTRVKLEPSLDRIGFQSSDVQPCMLLPIYRVCLPLTRASFTYVVVLEHSHLSFFSESIERHCAPGVGEAT